MILSTVTSWGSALAAPLLALSVLGYGLAAWPGAMTSAWGRWAPRLFMLGVVSHGLWVLLRMVLPLSGLEGWRLGWAPVLSLTVCLALVIHAWQRDFLASSKSRAGLAALGVAAIVLDAMYPGEPTRMASPWAPLHWALGVSAYGLLGAAVLHGVWLDRAERAFKARKAAGSLGLGMPLMQLERLTFRFVEWGFVALTGTVLLGALTSSAWRWDHKTVLSLLGWALVGGLLAARRWRGLRGHQAMTWLYGATLVLLLAYVGSRFVLQVVLGRGAA